MAATLVCKPRHAGKREFFCQTCGKSFWDWPSQRGKSNFCSHACYAQSMIGKSPGNKGRIIRTAKPCAHCGSTIAGIPSFVRKRKYCSQRCAGAAYSGPKHHGYRGGDRRSPDTYTTQAYRAWRLVVLSRDGGRCRWCDHLGNLNRSNLEVHHIIPVSADGSLLFDVGNSITLCRRHHKETQGRENEFAEFLSGLIGEPLRMTPTPNRRDRYPLRLTREMLITLYVDQQMGTPQIAAMHGCTSAAVLKYLCRHAIPRRTAKEAARVRRLKEIGHVSDACGGGRERQG